jgi:hypothetical protein
MDPGFDACGVKEMSTSPQHRTAFGRDRRQAHGAVLFLVLLRKSTAEESVATLHLSDDHRIEEGSWQP